MNLVDLSWRNMKRNFRLYSIYFISMLVGVVIYFTFSGLMFNEDVVAAIQNKENYKTVIFIASMIVFLFIVFFILYANSFFMKQRKKEFGMYILYGMKERQVATMVFFETLFLSAISVSSGILIGGLLSKFFGAVLMNLMHYNDDISFAFPLEAIVSTILLFALLIVIITIQSYFNVRRVQLVELFHAKEKMEKPLKFSMPLAILSILLIAVSYYMITIGDKDIWKDHFKETLIATTVALIVGTYLLFRQFSGWILQKMSQSKQYFKGNKMLWISSLRFSIRGNTVNFTFNSLISAIVIFAVGFIAVDYAVKGDTVKKEYPNHLAFSTQDAETQIQIEQMLNDSHPIIGHETITGIQTEKILNRKPFFSYPEYYTEEFYLFPESQLNAIVDLRGVGEKVDLEGEEAIVLTRGLDEPTKYKSPQPELTVLEDHTFRVVEKIRYPLLSVPTSPSEESTGPQPSVLVISDGAFVSLKENHTLSSYEIYKIEDPKTSNDVARNIYDIVMKTEGAYYSAYVDSYSLNTESSSLVLFSVAFFAVIALFALGSVIYFKQLREATEEREHYAILRKMGVDDKEIKKIIRKQLLFVFLPPLILGLVHSWYLLYYTVILIIKDLPSLTTIIFSVMGLYVLTYLIFYVSSTSIYYKIISEKNTR
ncbi:ABC transporter permease [Neobacillus drentensis]|uniref:ABC transporter permease n=1 Tax=Neobacillus drentensis TaxID=220684 RepID=UPI002FFEC514